MSDREKRKKLLELLIDAVWRTPPFGMNLQRHLLKHLLLRCQTWVLTDCRRPLWRRAEQLQQLYSGSNNSRMLGARVGKRRAQREHTRKRARQHGHARRDQSTRKARSRPQVWT